MARTTFKFPSQACGFSRIDGTEWMVEMDGETVGRILSVLAPPHRFAPDNEWRVVEYDVELYNGKRSTMLVKNCGTARKALAAAKAWAREQA